MYGESIHWSITKLSLVLRSLRILHVAPYSGDAWAYGGIPRLVQTLTRGLARRGHHVTLCTTDAGDESSRLQNQADPRSGVRAAWPLIRAADNVDVRVFPNVSNRLAYHLQLFLPIGLNRYLSEHARDFDVAHLHACRNLPGAIAARHLHRTGVPYVLAPNGTAPRIERRRLAKQVFDVVMGRRIVEGAARVLAVSHAEQLQFGQLGIESRVVRLVPNPVDLDEFSPSPERGRFRERLGLPGPSAVPVVMFLGKLTPRKRVDVLVRAFARVGDERARLVVAGNDMGTGAELRSLVRVLGLERRTIFTGLIRGRERLEALADASVVVYPSQDEIFGLVPLEALLVGTPVIVAADSGCGEVVGRTGGGQIVPCGDVDRLVRAIDQVLDSPSAWDTEAAACRIRAAYGGDVVCAELERVYEEMVTAA
jgi:glycosyltransferase involved in cell wall biosynthesis